MSETLGVAVLRLTTNDSKLKEGLDRAKSRAIRIGSDMRKIGKSMSLYATAPILGLGAAILKSAGDFETGMNKVRALTGATGDDFTKLREQAKQLGATTQFTAGQAADAMGFLAQAGLKTNDIFKTMPATLNLAAAAGTGLGETADMMTNIMAGFRMEAEESGRASDVLSKAFTSSNTNLAELAEAMSYAGPVLSGFGISFEETAAAVGLLGNAGIKASRAGTALSGALVRLASPASDAEEIMNRLGIQVYDSSGKMNSLVSIVEQLQSSGASAADIMKIFGLRAGPAMMALVSQGSSALQKLKGDLEGAGGTAQKIAAVQMEGFAGAMKKLQSALEAVAIAVADSGLLEFATNVATSLADWFREFSKTNPEILKWGALILGVTAAAGPLITALGFLIPLVVTLATAVLGVTWPIALVVAAIAGAVVAAWYLWNNWETVTKKISEWSDTWWGHLLQFVFNPLLGAINAVVAAWNFMKNLISTPVQTATPSLPYATENYTDSAGSPYINQSAPDTSGSSSAQSTRQPIQVVIEGDSDAMYSQRQVRRMAEALEAESADDSTSLQVQVL